MRALADNPIGPAGPSDVLEAAAYLKAPEGPRLSPGYPQDMHSRPN